MAQKKLVIKTSEPVEVTINHENGDCINMVFKPSLHALSFDSLFEFMSELEKAVYEIGAEHSGKTEEIAKTEAAAKVQADAEAAAKAQADAEAAAKVQADAEAAAKVQADAEAAAKPQADSPKLDEN